MTSSFLAVSAAALALGAAPRGARPPRRKSSMAPPATAQSDNTATHYWYGMFGVTDHEVFSGNLGTVDGRLGARWGWFGLEGEAGWGVNHHRIGNGVTGITGVKANIAGINDQQTIYGVGYLPLGRDIDLFARIGYGRTDLDFKGMTHPADDGTPTGMWAAAANGSGTARTASAPSTPGRISTVRPNADAWSVSYVRKF